MELVSTHLAAAPGGVVLTTTIEGETIQSYVVVAPPDINAVADIVPTSEFERGADVHATAVQLACMHRTCTNLRRTD